METIKMYYGYKWPKSFMNEWMNECLMTPEHKNKIGYWMGVKQMVFKYVYIKNSQGYKHSVKNCPKLFLCSSKYIFNIYVCVCVCVCVCTYVCTNIQMCEYMYLCVYVCIFIFEYMLYVCQVLT